MKRVCVYPRDGEVASSSYYRLIQYFSKFDQSNVKIRVFVPKVITQAVYNSKNDLKSVCIKIIYHSIIFVSSLFYFLIDNIFLPKYTVFLRSVEPKTFIFPINILYKRLVKKTICIWDFDDDIFTNHEIGEREKQILINYSNKIIVTHQYLKNIMSNQIQNKIICLPTTDGDFIRFDISKKINERLKTYQQNFKIVWLASSAGLEDIKSIANYIDLASKILKEKYGKKITLTVICNRPLDYHFLWLDVNYVKWSRERAISIMMNCHLGIMPLRKNKFALGKGGFKIIQYMAAGLPNIASDVGFNSEVVLDGVSGYLIGCENKWIDEIIHLALNQDDWYNMSINAYKRWKEKFDYNKNYQYWKNITSIGELRCDENEYK